MITFIVLNNNDRDDRLEEAHSYFITFDDDSKNADDAIDTVQESEAETLLEEDYEDATEEDKKEARRRVEYGDWAAFVIPDWVFEERAKKEVAK